MAEQIVGTKYIDIVFDGPPGHEGGRFVEVENDKGESVRVGEWVQDGPYWRLRIPRLDAELVRANHELAEELSRFEASR